MLTPEEQERMESLIRDRVRARTSKRLRTTREQIHNQFTELLKQAVATPVERGGVSLALSLLTDPVRPEPRFHLLQAGA